MQKAQVVRTTWACINGEEGGIRPIRRDFLIKSTTYIDAQLRRCMTSRMTWKSLWVVYRAQ